MNIILHKSLSTSVFIPLGYISKNKFTLSVVLNTYYQIVFQKLGIHLKTKSICQEYYNS